jgi:beta-lactamase class A
MVEAFRQFEAGEAAPDEIIPVRDADRVPICGVLTLMHSGLEPTLMDLIWLMITISDNMATNLLIDRLGVENIQRTLEGLGLAGTRIQRKLFDSSATAAGKSNIVTAWDMGLLMEKLYRGEAVSETASAQMIDVLLAQQLSNKMPFRLPLDCKIAHKTGETSGVTHDVGIVYAEKPFVAGFFGSGVNAPALARLMADVTYALAELNGGMQETEDDD